TATGNQSTYQDINYYARKDIVLSKNNIVRQAVGFGDTLYYDGKNYGVTDNPYGIPGANGITHNIDGGINFVDYLTKKKITLGPNLQKFDMNSSQARVNTSKVKYYYGYTFKGGANYNLTEHQNVFFNLGYMNLVPKYNNVFDNYGKEQYNIVNQVIRAGEVGYGLKYRTFAINLNGYYTIWNNKPLDYPLSYTGSDGNTYYYNINNINALHKGIELDGTYNITRKIKFNAFTSFADWRYTSGYTTAYIYDNSKLIDSVRFSAKNVHVGNSAQIQYGGGLRYEPVKGLYIRAAITYFGKNYANFDPSVLNVQKSPPADFRNHESWRMPDYYFMDLFAGYSIKLAKIDFVLTGSINNLLDQVYITDASFASGTSPLLYNATNATVYMSQGRRWNLGLRATF
ncbi:MAG TPA: hypothetical protein VNX68_03175, partial [Nitrosopumilaceae archaeon]|nr:hypothetical protein [Nitrosopumilaceae archaeon]